MVDLCHAVLKTGPNAGKKCRSPAKIGNFCGRHASAAAAVPPKKASLAVKELTPDLKKKIRELAALSKLGLGLDPYYEIVEALNLGSSYSIEIETYILKRLSLAEAARGAIITEEQGIFLADLLDKGDLTKLTTNKVLGLFRKKFGKNQERMLNNTLRYLIQRMSMEKNDLLDNDPSCQKCMKKLSSL